MQILLLLSTTQVVGGFNVDKLTKCIMEFLLNEGGMGENGTKLVACGAQWRKSIPWQLFDVMAKICESWAPFGSSVHFVFIKLILLCKPYLFFLSIH